MKDYISSGVLENYVLGLLSEKEAGDVIDMMKLHPDVYNYVHSLQSGMEQYSNLYAASPPEELKDRVMESIRVQIAARGDLHPGRPAFVGFRNWRKLAIAAAVILLCSIGLNIYLSYQMLNTTAKVNNLSLQNKQLVSDDLLIQDQLKQTRKQLALLSNPDMHPVVMNGVKQHSDLKATIYWNARSKTVYLGKADLPEVPEGKVYQLWAIVDGKPVDLGLFSPKDNSRLPIEMKKVQPGKVQAFAITLEKQGGSPIPTMDQMYVMGATS